MPVSRRTIPSAPVVLFRPRVIHHGEIALGPGKADLLEAIEAGGSISGGARRLGMSYMKAWTLVKIMNRSFRGPLVEVGRGGRRGGAAHLTPLGREVLALYRDLVEKSEKASRDTWRLLRRRLN